jgi:hypothetical protein
MNKHTEKTSPFLFNGGLWFFFFFITAGAQFPDYKSKIPISIVSPEI